MFTGEHIHSIDNKKRLAIPARFRKEIGQKPILTKGLDNCLFLFPEAEWNKFVEKLSLLSVGQSNARKFVRSFVSGAVEVEFDSLGRILIPDYLKDYAGLKKKIAVAGVLNRLEIWDLENWERYKETTEKGSDAIAEKLGELGLI